MPRAAPVRVCLMILGVGCLLATGIRPAMAQRGVDRGSIAPHWSADESHFWYRTDLPSGQREFIFVDALRGERRLAFDHPRMATALAAVGVTDSPAERLAITDLEFRLADNTVRVQVGDAAWMCRLDSYELTRSDDQTARPEIAQGDTSSTRVPRASLRSGAETELAFDNRSAGEVELFWVDEAGQRRSYGKLAAGSRKSQHTFAGHVWEAVAESGRTVGRFVGEEQPATATIREGVGGTRPESRPRIPFRGSRDISPDGQWRAYIHDHNVFVRASDAEREIQISHDGEPTHAYGLLEWSPDSQTLVGFRIDPGEELEVHLIQSSPPAGGRAQLRSRKYPLPGDKFAAYELNLFRRGDWQATKPAVDRLAFGRPRLRWNRDGSRFTYEQVDRGHQRFRIIEVAADSGSARPILDEKSDTFLWTQHNDHGPLTTYLEPANEIIYVSERDGWKHLYLIDAELGTIANAITSGPWVVRGIETIDEEKRQVWFRASGIFPDQDPYLIHYGRVNFDGRDLVWLTSGNGTHSVRFSPSRRYLIDTYSRVDQPPTHELRRAVDGALVCLLETADVSALQTSGWRPPEVFVAKGRDGTTDIWGIIHRPASFDPLRKYPVIEAIYAGPQDSYVPKSFSPAQRHSALTELGFVVAQIDGMGTANRSKAFHDACWKNLKDAGFPDRILWHQAVAAKYPWYDISRVGIFGGSAGGQNSTGALLFHSDFYQVAVSSCGCHDNRMDKASWNEQWMGYPVGTQYAESSNIENAHRLLGKLLLIVGELDTNVPPESTLRLADALIKAGKDFELVVIPGAGHGDGGRYGDRRRRDFFVRHLLGEEPPDRNAAP